MTSTGAAAGQSMERHDWLSRLIMFSATKSVLVDQASNGDDSAHQALTRVAEAQVADRRGPGAGVSSSQGLTASQKRNLVGAVEEQLVQQCQLLNEFWEASRGDSKSSGSWDELPSSLQRAQADIARSEAATQHELKEAHEQHLALTQTLLEAVGLLVTVVRDHLLGWHQTAGSQAAAAGQERVATVAAKLKSLQVEVHAKTYTPDAVKALANIKKLLTESRAAAAGRLATLQSRLLEYKRVGIALPGAAPAAQSPVSASPAAAVRTPVAASAASSGVSAGAGAGAAASPSRGHGGGARGAEFAALAASYGELLRRIAQAEQMLSELHGGASAGDSSGGGGVSGATVAAGDGMLRSVR